MSTSSEAMGQRMDRYNFRRMIEMDEGYFTIESLAAGHKKHRKRGAASNSQILSVMAEIRILEDWTRKVERQCLILIKVLKTIMAGETRRTLGKAIDGERDRCFYGQKYLDVKSAIMLKYTAAKNLTNRPQVNPQMGAYCNKVMRK